MAKVWDFVKSKVWPVIKAIPALVRKTRAGKFLVAAIVTALLKRYYPDLTFDQVAEVLNFILGMVGIGAVEGQEVGTTALLVTGVLGTLYGNEGKDDFKRIINDKTPGTFA